MAIYGAGGAAYHLDTGAADAYVLNPVSPKESPPAYFDGFMVIFEPGNVNTGASTVNINSIGVKNITMNDGSAPPAGIIAGVTTIKYDLSNDRFELMGNAIGNMSITVVTASGTYNPPANVRALEFTVVGGGGGGGGVDGQGAGTSAAAGGGGGGGFTISAITNIDFGGYTIAIGAGGAGGTGTGGNTGTSGGTTTVTATGFSVSATGGGGGGGLVASAGFIQAGGGAGGVGASGDLNQYGNDGLDGTAYAGQIIAGGYGGSTIFCGARRGLVALNGRSYGSGGSGASARAVATDTDGGDGLDGVVIVKEFF